MRSRPDALAVGLLTVLTLGVTSTSATLALQSPAPAVATGVAASLPPVLFSPEPPATPVSPVRADLAGPADEAVGLASPAPEAPAPAPPKPSVQPPRVRLTLAYALTRAQGTAVITYTATVRNDAPMTLQGLTLASHVPAGTVWRAAAPCRGDARPLEQVHSDQSRAVICVPMPRAGVDVPGAHATVAVFDRPVPPGGSISSSWTVEVGAAGRVVNHVHLTGPGIDGQSPEVVVDVP
jgi:hypothetical protein